MLQTEDEIPALVDVSSTNDVHCVQDHRHQALSSLFSSARAAGAADKGF